ncbi:RanBP2-type domain-containing protein [Pleurotus pulmonarius]
MSAVRSTNKRRHNRSAISSPYARPAAKKSSWSLFGFLNYLNPLRGKQAQEDTESDSSSSVEDESFTAGEVSEAAPQTLSSRGKQMEERLSISGSSSLQNGFSAPHPAPTTPTPLRASASFPFPVSPSPAKNLDTVSTFLTEHRGKRLSEVEVEGLVSLIENSKPSDNSEPFRFTSTPPGRSASPLAQSSSLPSVASATPRKVLTKNPNGVYRWEGAGSAKRSRNRYHSPAFGPSRSTPDRLKLGTSSPNQPPVPRMDTKRRRLGEDATSSSASPSGGSSSNGHPVHAKTPSPPPRASAPAPSPTRAAQACPFPSLNSPLSPSPTTNGNSNQSQSKTNSTSRLRIPQKPTTPVIPSPLRQTWSQQGDGSPPQAGSSSGQPQRQTMAANFMTELIKEVTPPKRPDVSNPYQTASPVKPTPSSRPKPKRARATGKPAPPPGRDAEQTDNKPEIAKTEKPLSEYSPQAIIEATLPKGSKRSRPTFGKPAARNDTPETSGDEDVSMDDRSSKRRKDEPVSFFGARSTPLSAPPPAIRVESVDDTEMTTNESSTSVASILETPTTTAPPAAKSTVAMPLFGVPKASSIPREPSKLRHSYQPDGNTDDASKGNDVPPTPKLSPAQVPPPAPEPLKSPTKSAFGLGLGFPSRSEPAPVKAAPPSDDPQAAALAIPTASLPAFTFKVPRRSSAGTDVAAMDYARSVPVDKLPKFEFVFGKKAVATPATPSVPAPSTTPAPATQGFNWAAAGMKPAAPKAGGGWTCSTCMLPNPATAVDKCTVCETPR